jgi:GNAT superfamily N-acetyltransferase
MFRRATQHDVLGLASLERDANLVGLRHVFAPERHPFPFEAVLSRWQLVLDDPAAVTLVLDDPEERRLDLYLAYDSTTVRHVGVRPERWGEGLATAAMRLALADIAARGTGTAHLWVLEENHRARRLYEHLGWRAGDERREAPWPPHPTEVGYTCCLPRAGDAGV